MAIGFLRLTDCLITHFMTYFEALLIALIEGLTEFLPVSSTGHMILTSACLGLEHTEFLKSFEISIQLGAILAIAWIYARRFLLNGLMYQKLFVAFLPTAAIGYFFYGIIKHYLFSPLVVAISLIAGGILLIWLDKRVVQKDSNYESMEQISFRNAFWIGLIQSVSIIPGVSRAGASIIGGIFNGFNKKQATEFSFLLAVPTMVAATAYDLLKSSAQFSGDELKLLGIGSLMAFCSAWIAVKGLLLFVEKYGFSFFGWYRIAIGLLFLIFIQYKLIP